jgi:hypothetical protein
LLDAVKLIVKIHSRVEGSTGIPWKTPPNSKKRKWKLYFHTDPILTRSRGKYTLGVELKMSVSFTPVSVCCLSMGYDAQFNEIHVVAFWGVM